jgi:carboxylesterase
MPLLPDAAPVLLPGGPTAVLVLHGFSGQPYSVKPWARHLAEAGGLTVSVPRLPGHGTTWQEMNLTRWPDWYGEAERAFLALRADHEQVFVMGLSMGGTLALRLAQQHADQVAGVVVVNPSVFTTRPDKYLVPVLRHVMPGYPGITNDIKRPGGDEYGYPKLPLHAVDSLFGLWEQTRDGMAEVTAPLMVFTSVEDHVVEPANSTWIMDNVSSAERHQILLANSYHVATLDNDAERIFAGSLGFVAGHVRAAADR